MAFTEGGPLGIFEQALIVLCSADSNFDFISDTQRHVWIDTSGPIDTLSDGLASLSTSDDVLRDMTSCYNRYLQLERAHHWRDFIKLYRESKRTCAPRDLVRVQNLAVDFSPLRGLSALSAQGKHADPAISEVPLEMLPPMHAEYAMQLSSGLSQLDATWTDSYSQQTHDMWLLFIGALLALLAADAGIVLMMLLRSAIRLSREMGLTFDPD